MVTGEFGCSPASKVFDLLDIGMKGSPSLRNGFRDQKILHKLSGFKLAKTAAVAEPGGAAIQRRDAILFESLSANTFGDDLLSVFKSINAFQGFAGDKALEGAASRFSRFD